MLRGKMGEKKQKNTPVPHCLNIEVTEEQQGL
jgi:hypothetical protein